VTASTCGGALVPTPRRLPLGAAPHIAVGFARRLRTAVAFAQRLREDSISPTTGTARRGGRTCASPAARQD